MNLEEVAMTLEELEKKFIELEALEKQVQVLTDIEEIKKLHTNYTYWLCNKQFDEMLDCFVEDAVADIVGKIFQGKAAISAFFYNVLAKNNPKDGHITAQPVITINGTKAHAVWLLFMTYSEPTMRYAQGRQEADYVKVKGQWKMQTMKFIMPWPKA
jgi:ketosteroid isomerase-like protein